MPEERGGRRDGCVDEVVVIFGQVMRRVGVGRRVAARREDR